MNNTQRAIVYLLVSVVLIGIAVVYYPTALFAFGAPKGLYFFVFFFKALMAVFGVGFLILFAGALGKIEKDE